MKQRFFELAGRLERGLAADETLLLGLDAERSDFVRFNRGRVSPGILSLKTGYPHKECSH